MVYVESADTFLVLDIVAYVRAQFGASILTLDQKTVDVPLSTKSVLDAHAFDLIMRAGTAQEWTRVLNADGDDVDSAQRDYRLIWKLGTAKERGAEHRLEVKDWQSKLRGEAEFFERPIGGSDEDWRSIREHWQLHLRIEVLEKAYPYLTFEAFDEERQDQIDFWSNEDEEPSVEFANGTVVYGQDCAGEYHIIRSSPSLERGRRTALRVGGDSDQDEDD